MEIQKPSTGTCILAQRDEGTIIIAGDRRVTVGLSYQRNARPKVVERGGVVFGGSGDLFLCEILTRSFPIPKKESIKQMNTDYMFNTFIPSLIKWLRKEKWIMKKESRQTTFNSGAHVLAGIGSDLFEIFIGKEILVYEVSAPYSIGCGAEYAMGALSALSEYKSSGVRSNMILAVKIASRFSIGCDDDVNVADNEGLSVKVKTRRKK